MNKIYKVLFFSDDGEITIQVDGKELKYVVPITIDSEDLARASNDSLASVVRIAVDRLNEKLDL